MKFRAGVEKLAESIDSMESASLESDIRKMATDVVKEHESGAIEEQKKVKISIRLFEEWKSTNNSDSHAFPDL